MAKASYNAFIRWYYNTFQTSKLYQDMANTVENSPWHRERSVATHTDMVVGEYLSTAEAWVLDTSVILGALACAFHDTGKPMSKQNKYKPERGNYVGFNGHELASARLWEDYAVRNWKSLREELELEPQDIYIIGWMIENHRPWGTKDENKLKELASTLIRYGINEAFFKMLLADNRGRIGDNHDANYAKSHEWMENFDEMFFRYLDDENGDAGLNVVALPTLLMPIGASGSGKSTFFADMVDGDANKFSLDDLRLEFYGEPYSEAFQKSCDDNKFEGKAQQRFRELVKAGRSVYVDNTNTGRRRRNSYTIEARKAGYRTTAILMPIDLETLQKRQFTRGDKCVPADAVSRQYFGTSYPNIGEFDEVIVWDGNLPK